jgi:hypothetical protein
MREQAGEQTEVSPGQSDAGRDALRRWKGTGRDTPAGAQLLYQLAEQRRSSRHGHPNPKNVTFPA